MVVTYIQQNFNAYVVIRTNVQAYSKDNWKEIISQIEGSAFRRRGHQNQHIDYTVQEKAGPKQQLHLYHIFYLHFLMTRFSQLFLEK